MADEHKLRPSTYRRPWHGYKSQEELNNERTKIPLMKVVNENAHRRIAAIRNSPNYQAAFAQDARSALKIVKAPKTPILEFTDVHESNHSLNVSPNQPSIKLGRFSVSDAPTSVEVGRFSVSDAPTSVKVGRFSIEDSKGGGRRRKIRNNISRRRRHVGRRRTHRNGTQRRS
jgi:hypothetical protein